MSREPTSTESTDKSQKKIWIWSAVGLLITNLVVASIVAFLIHRDSVQDSPNERERGTGNREQGSKKINCEAAIAKLLTHKSVKITL